MIATMRTRPERGQAIIESALILLAFCVVIFGAMDFALLAMASNFVSYAAGEGARYAMVHGTASGSPTDGAAVQTFVRGLAAGIPNASAIEVNTTWPVDQNPGSPVKVSVTYSYQPMVLLAIKTAIPVSSQSQMTIRQ
jgi:Flp pilus assembly protein TadG